MSKRVYPFHPPDAAFGLYTQQENTAVNVILGLQRHNYFRLRLIKLSKLITVTEGFCNNEHLQIVFVPQN